MRPARSGARAVVPGRPADSELIRRILAEKDEDRMPPAETHRELTAAQRELLRRWITEGAEYRDHWAFMPPVRTVPPAVKRLDWPRNAIDHFVLARLEARGLEPSPEGDRTTQLRRLTLDLTGLPPSPAEVDAFLAADSAGAWEERVDCLLASPRFGERMARDWLDAARFADSNGYQVDRDREMWAWRDWVIQAFNRNLPFDRFTVEQLAGDLLPEPTLDQRIATGFCRNHMINEEGGIIPDEFLTEYCADRVETMATVWLGLTMNCARCHDHKHDPLTQRDYYGLFAFFHNVSESGVGTYGASIRRNTPPFVKLPAPEAEAALSALNLELTGVDRELDELTNALLADPPAWESQTLDCLAERATGGTPTGPVVPPEPELPPEIIRLLLTPYDRRSPEDHRRLKEFRLSLSNTHGTLTRRVAELRRRIDETDLSIPISLVMAELPEPRPTHLLIRGVYDRKGERIAAATPAKLPRFPSGTPTNRLGLARWLVSPSHPLTARVSVNRLWQSVFGTGLVRTPGDFGMQGDPPSHPDLLDWLAVEFVESGWDVKRLVRLMVTSACYRQDSRVRRELREADPENRLLARGPRHRLSAEEIRDQALFVSGALVERLGGPSVKPYHPPGLYEQVVAGSSADTYVQDHGASLYRRSLYTYWKRSVPNPAMLVFDAPFRETCVVRRARTSTPLQALNLLNDPTHVEAARLLAGRLLHEGGTTCESRLRLGGRLVLGRELRPAELEVLRGGLNRATDSFRTDPAGVAGLLGVGETKPDRGVDSADLAAWTTVAATLLNLDEALTRE